MGNKRLINLINTIIAVVGFLLDYLYNEAKEQCASCWMDERELCTRINVCDRESGVYIQEFNDSNGKYLVKDGTLGSNGLTRSYKLQHPKVSLVIKLIQ